MENHVGPRAGGLPSLSYLSFVKLKKCSEERLNNMSPTTAATNLDFLPPELLLLISQHLSPVDSTCLALCNHRLFTIPFPDLLRRSPSEGSRGSSVDNLRIDLLTTLTRNWPEYYLCYACMRLHLWRHVKLPAPGFKLRGCYDGLPWDKAKSLCLSLFLPQFPTYSTYGFHWLHLYLAMRRFYLGASFGIPLESLFYTEVTRDSHPSTYSQQKMPEANLHRVTRTSLRSVEARISPSPSSFCLRIQELAITSRQNASYIFPRRLPFEVCRHINNQSFVEIIKSVLEVYRQEGPGTPGLSDHGQCHECNTAWSLDLREVEVDKVCLVLTRWKDLGPGLSPEDPRWRVQLPWGPWVSLADTDMLNDPRVRFETYAEDCQGPSSQRLSVDEILARNLALLRNRRYQRTMKQWQDGRWFLQGHEDETKRSRMECVVI